MLAAASSASSSPSSSARPSNIVTTTTTTTAAAAAFDSPIRLYNSNSNSLITNAHHIYNHNNHLRSPPLSPASPSSPSSAWDAAAASRDDFFNFVSLIDVYKTTTTTSFSDPAKNNTQYHHRTAAPSSSLPSSYSSIPATNAHPHHPTTGHATPGAAAAAAGHRGPNPNNLESVLRQSPSRDRPLSPTTTSSKNRIEAFLYNPSSDTNHRRRHQQHQLASSPDAPSFGGYQPDDVADSKSRVQQRIAWRKYIEQLEAERLQEAARSEDDERNRRRLKEQVIAALLSKAQGSSLGGGGGGGPDGSSSHVNPAIAPVKDQVVAALMGGTKSPSQLAPQQQQQHHHQQQQRPVRHPPPLQQTRSQYEPSRQQPPPPSMLPVQQQRHQQKQYHSNIQAPLSPVSPPPSSGVSPGGNIGKLNFNIAPPLPTSPTTPLPSPMNRSQSHAAAATTPTTPLSPTPISPYPFFSAANLANTVASTSAPSEGSHGSPTRSPPLPIDIPFPPVSPKAPAVIHLKGFMDGLRSPWTLAPAQPPPVPVINSIGAPLPSASSSLSRSYPSYPMQEMDIRFQQHQQRQQQQQSNSQNQGQKLDRSMSASPPTLSSSSVSMAAGKTQQHQHLSYGSSDDETRGLSSSPTNPLAIWRKQKEQSRHSVVFRGRPQSMSSFDDSSLPRGSMSSQGRPLQQQLSNHMALHQQQGELVDNIMEQYQLQLQHKRNVEMQHMQHQYQQHQQVQQSHQSPQPPPRLPPPPRQNLHLEQHGERLDQPGTWGSSISALAPCVSTSDAHGSLGRWTQLGVDEGLCELETEMLLVRSSSGHHASPTPVLNAIVGVEVMNQWDEEFERCGDAAGGGRNDHHQYHEEDEDSVMGWYSVARLLIMDLTAARMRRPQEAAAHRALVVRSLLLRRQPDGSDIASFPPSSTSLVLNASSSTVAAATTTTLSSSPLSASPQSLTGQQQPPPLKGMWCPRCGVDSTETVTHFLLTCPPAAFLWTRVTRVLQRLTGVRVDPRVTLRDIVQCFPRLLVPPSVDSSAQSSSPTTTQSPTTPVFSMDGVGGASSPSSAFALKPVAGPSGGDDEDGLLHVGAAGLDEDAQRIIVAVHGFALHSLFAARTYPLAETAVAWNLFRMLLLDFIEDNGLLGFDFDIV